LFMPAASKLKRAFSIVVLGPKGTVLANVGALVVETNAPGLFAPLLASAALDGGTPADVVLVSKNATVFSGGEF